MKKLFLLLLLLPLGMMGQEMSKYLEGMVPEEDGKVVFRRSVEAPGLSKQQVFVRVARMAQERFKEGKEEAGRVVYSDLDEGVVVAWGDEYLVFVQKSLVLDRARVSFQVTYAGEAGRCQMEVTRVRYTYGEGRKEPILAEEWITDKHAYDKKRGKLLKGSEKFRVKTIDLVGQLEKELGDALGVVPTEPTRVKELAIKEETTTTLPRETTTIAVTAPASREGYHRVLPAEVSGNFIAMLMHGKLTLVGEGTSPSTISTQWGGIGYLFNKPVAYCFVVPSRESYDLIDNTESYTLVWTPDVPGQSLYKEVVFECRKVVAQSVASEAISGEELKREWSGKALPKLYAGEIVSVWAK